MGTSVELAVIGDIHCHWTRLERVLERVAASGAQGILLVGDLGAGGLHLARWRSGSRIAVYERSVREVLARVEALGKPVLWVPGNHDLPDLEGPGNVDMRCATMCGLRVAGIGGAGPARFGFAYEWGEDEIRARALPDCDVLLCHAPPLGTPLDQLARNGKHVGSQALRERAERHDGVYVCGHIHEAPGAAQIGRCLCLNAGGLGEPFGRSQVGFVRFDEALAGRFEVRHEDLESGSVRAWMRSEPGGGSRASSPGRTSP